MDTADLGSVRSSAGDGAGPCAGHYRVRARRREQLDRLDVSGRPRHRSTGHLRRLGGPGAGSRTAASGRPACAWTSPAGPPRNDHTGCTGSGFVAGYEGTGAADTYKIDDVPSAGDYTLAVRYAATGTYRLVNRRTHVLTLPSASALRDVAQTRGPRVGAFLSAQEG
jgi:hypothetical protein